MHRNNFLTTATIISLLWSAIPALGISATEKEPELARLMVLDYHNDTGSKDYDYLSESLNTAVDKSLEKRFVYKKVDGSGVKLPGNPDKAASWKKILIKDKKADIVVYGSYRLLENGKQVEIVSEVLLFSEDKHFRMDAVRSTLDNKIFAATDKSAALVVERMSAVASERSKDTEKPVASDGKVAIIAEQKKQIFDGGWELFAELGIGKTDSQLNEIARSVQTAPSITLQSELTFRPATAYRLGGGVSRSGVTLSAWYEFWNPSQLDVSGGGTADVSGRNSLKYFLLYFTFFRQAGNWQGVSLGFASLENSADVSVANSPVDLKISNKQAFGGYVGAGYSLDTGLGFLTALSGEMILYKNNPPDIETAIYSPTDISKSLIDGPTGDTALYFRLSLGISQPNWPGMLLFTYSELAYTTKYTFFDNGPISDFNSQIDVRIRSYQISYQHRLHL